MKTMKRISMERLGGIILTVLIITLAPWAASYAATPLQGKPIKIGVTYDYSGITAGCGAQEGPAIEMAVKEVNDAGGINGRPVELFISDNGADPAKAIGHIQRYVQEKGCVALIVGTTSSINLAVKPWAEKNKIPAISPTAMSDKLTVSEGKAWWFRSNASNKDTVEVACIRLKELGFTKVGYEGSAAAFGTDQLASLRQLSPKFGIKLIGEVLCEPKSKDLTIQAKSLRDTGAEAVVQAEYANELGVWGRALKTIGWKPYMFSTGAELTQTVETYPKELFEGWEYWDLADNTKPFANEVWDRFRKFTGMDRRTCLVTRGYDAARALLEAIRLSGDPDNPEAIRDGFYKIKDLPLAGGNKKSMGNFGVGRNALLGPNDIPVYVIRSGKLEIAR